MPVLVEELSLLTMEDITVCAFGGGDGSGDVRSQAGWDKSLAEEKAMMLQQLGMIEEEVQARRAYAFAARPPAVNQSNLI